MLCQLSLSFWSTEWSDGTLLLIGNLNLTKSLLVIVDITLQCLKQTLSMFWCHDNTALNLRLMGRKIYCIPESEVYHVGGGTLPKSNPMKTYLNFRNNLTMLYKNLSDTELTHVMRMRRFLDYLAAFETLVLNRNWGDFKAIFKARRAFKAWKHEFDEDRRKIQAGRVKEEIPQVYNLSIIWQYYAKGKKLFSQL